MTEPPTLGSGDQRGAFLSMKQDLQIQHLNFPCKMPHLNRHHVGQEEEAVEALNQVEYCIMGGGAGMEATFGVPGW